ncbi:MAG: IS630 family transposase [Armatimonadetes bacterium]|nr:IS630 family transposase [Armatimonadota bacterium]NIO96625.1 IS630 family transposase [Armatimonadota bacterium]
MSEDGDYELLFVDESEAHLNPPLTKVWARTGHPARVPAAGEDQRAVAFGAWNFGTQQLEWHLCERKNSEEFLKFLHQLLAQKPAERRLILVMDNAAYHRAKKVKKFLRDHEDAMEPFWLPPYSPELNLIERVWRYVKENVTNNYYFGHMHLLLEALREACRELSSPAETLLQVNFKTGKYFAEAA